MNQPIDLYGFSRYPEEEPAENVPLIIGYRAKIRDLGRYLPRVYFEIGFYREEEGRPEWWLGRRPIWPSLRQIPDEDVLVFQYLTIPHVVGSDDTGLHWRDLRPEES